MQGLRPFSSSIPKTLKKHLRKGGYNYSSIIENWTKMVSKKISDACYPSNVKTGKEMKNNTLVLEFNEYGILNSKDFYNINDMKKIEFAEDITVNEIKKQNFIYSFLTSVRQKMSNNRK